HPWHSSSVERSARPRYAGGLPPRRAPGGPAGGAGWPSPNGGFAGNGRGMAVLGGRRRGMGVTTDAGPPLSPAEQSGETVTQAAWDQAGVALGKVEEVAAGGVSQYRFPLRELQ